MRTVKIQGSYLIEILKLMRIHQWPKNLLILVPLIMAHKIMDFNLLLKSMYTVFAFSVLASIVYIINDIRDLDSDKNQEYKKTRPLASGSISRNASWKLLLLLTGTELILIQNIASSVLVLFFCYFVVNFLYTYYLKKIVILDLLCLTAFYLFRIFIGGESASVPISFWLLFFSSLLFFSLSALKRVAELQMNKNNHLNLTSRGYGKSDQNYLSSVGMIAGFAAVTVLGLYINDNSITVLYKSPELLWLTIPIVIYIVSKLWLDTSRGKMHYDPVTYLVYKKEFIASIFLLFIVILLASR